MAVLVKNMDRTVRLQICRLLDDESYGLHDGKMLAEKLGMDKLMIRLLWQPCGSINCGPTELFLRLWEEKGPNVASVKNLRGYLVKIKREDVVYIIDKAYGTEKPQGIRLTINNRKVNPLTPELLKLSR